MSFDAVLQAVDERMALNASVVTEYQGQHGAPDHLSGAPLHDLTGNGTYPDDVYQYGERYYGIGDGSDRGAWGLVFALHRRPRRSVTVYRAIPKDLPRGTTINPGDWVTVSRAYAAQHGRGALNDEYRVIQKTVKAGQLFTAGDSILEWGYDPVELPPAPPKRPMTDEQRQRHDEQRQRHETFMARHREEMARIQHIIDDLKKRST